MVERSTGQFVSAHHFLLLLGLGGHGGSSAASGGAALLEDGFISHWIHQTIVAVAIFQEALKQVSLTGKTPSEANRLLQAGVWAGGRWRAYEENLGFDDSEMHHYVP